jgi:hypothetical protein
MAKSFLRQSVDQIRAGHIPNSLEANTAFAITESAHQAFPDDVQKRAQYITAASQAAKTYMEQNDPRLQIQQQRVDLELKRLNQAYASDNARERDRAAAQNDLAINRLESQLARSESLLKAAEPGWIDSLASTFGSKKAKAKEANFGALQTDVANYRSQLNQMLGLRNSARPAPGQPAAPTGAPAASTGTGGPGAMAAPGGMPPNDPTLPRDKMRIRNNKTGQIMRYPVGEVPANYSRVQ